MDDYETTTQRIDVEKSSLEGTMEFLRELRREVALDRGMSTEHSDKIQGKIADFLNYAPVLTSYLDGIRETVGKAFEEWAAGTAADYQALDHDRLGERRSPEQM